MPFSKDILTGASGQSGAASGFYEYQIEQSVRLQRSTTSNSGTNGSGFYRDSGDIPTPTNSKKFTFSTWIKKHGAGLDLDQILLFAIVSSAGKNIYIDSTTDSKNDVISCGEFGTGAYQYDAKLRDVSAWYHLVFIWDTTQGTAANRQKFYINGTQQDVGDTRHNWGQNDTVWWNTGISHNAGYAIGYNAFGHTEGNSYGCKCSLAETIGIDGQDVSISDLGETKNGVWVPKDPSGLTFGNNGYYLKYENASDLGNDSSGNNNDFNTTNLGSDHQTLDSPTFGS